MKKRLLFAFMALCVTVSGFALEKNEYVYTPQGRFMITGDNLNANNAFQDMSGWTVISASAEKTLADNFNIIANGYGEGFNSVASTDGAIGEGMYYTFVPTSASDSYVVSFKLKGAATVTTRLSTIGYNGNNVSLGDVLPNGVKIEGNSDNVYGGTTDVVVCNTAEELTDGWQTFNYAIVGDGINRSYFISFTNMSVNVEIADLQIAPALQYADLRQRNAMLEKLNVYKNCYDWPAEVLADMGYDEAIAALEAIGDESGQADLDEQIAVAQEILDEFVKANMDDYLAGNADNYLVIKTTDGNTNKTSNIGEWNCLPAGRGFWSNGAYPDMGHFQKGSQWAYNDPTAPMGIYMQKELTSGSYVFAIDANSALRENAQQSWYIDEGMKPAYGVAYIGKLGTVKDENGNDVIAVTDTIASVVQDLEPVNFTPFFVTAKISEDATYEIGFKAYCKDAYKELLLGSVVYVANASLWGKNANKYNQKQLAYEENVRAQITAGRENLTKADGYLVDLSYFWGSDELKAVVDEIEPKIAAYEALDQDAIIATFEEDVYVNSTSDPNGLLQYEVYQNATKFIIAANKKFEAVNDTLNSIQVAIDDAEAVLAMRLYSAATGKDALKAAIEKAKGVQAAMKDTDYSEENAATVVAANAELAEAVEAFKNSIPAAAIATLVDIDFEQDAVQNDDQTYSISGAAGAMVFDHFSFVAPEGEDSPFQQGHWDNGEQKWKGYLRVGNGTATVLFDPKPAGASDMGDNILKFNFDFFIQGLNNRSVGFLIENETDSLVAGIYHNYYQGTTTTNTFNADMSKVWAKSGGSYNDASPAGVEDPTANPIQKTSFEVIIDYGTKTAYCTISSINGTATSEPVPCDLIPVKYLIQCDYDNKFATRRCWFDNLKIQRIATDGSAIDGILEVNPAAKVVAPTKVMKNGRLVINGKYGVNGIIIK